MTIVYLGIGSNLGNRKTNLDRAIRELDLRGIKTEKVSSIYETEPLGVEGQADYLNQVVIAKTELSPHELLKTVNEIERLLGRVRLVHWGSRTIDIDILFYGDQIIRTDDLLVPHPLLHKRNFVMIPFCEIAEDFSHPVLHVPMGILLKNSTDKSGVIKYTHN